jgi:hypothetical protein
MMHYVLSDSGDVVPCPDVLTWAQWFETATNRIVAQDCIEKGSDVKVSTVFLGLDHNFSSHGPPLLWETMVFGGPHDGLTQRYASLATAQAGHRAVCQQVFAT